MKREKPRPYFSAERCQYRYNYGLEDEDICGKPLTPPEQRYCQELHSELGPKQNKAIMQKVRKDVEKHRNKYKYSAVFQSRNSNGVFRSNNGFTKPKLKSLLDRSEALEKAYPIREDERYERIIKNLSELGQRLLDPPDGVLNAFAEATKQVNNWLKELHNQPDTRQSYERDRLIIIVNDILRHIGQPLSEGVFTARLRTAERLREQWRQRGELRHLADALITEAELKRLLFLDTKQWRFWKQALTRLDAAIYLCGLALSRCTSEQEKTALLLHWYASLCKLRLAFDVPFDDHKPNQASKYMADLRPLTNEVLASYDTGPIIESVNFLTTITEAEYRLKHHELMEAEELVSTVQSCSNEEDITVSYIKAELALAKSGGKDHEEVQKFIQLLQRYPFLSYIYQLHQLKAKYRNIDISEVSLLKGNDIFIETMSKFCHTRHIHSYVIDV